jgi:hypothetical protein
MSPTNPRRDGFSVVATTIPDSVTVCITSCARLDLLAKTVSSFRRFNRGGRFILSEDSTDAITIETLKQTYPDMLVLSGSDRLGLMGSIDRLYSTATTPYLFHLEDDWEFDGPVDWWAAIELLETRDDVANVSVRAIEEIKDKYRVRSDEVEFGSAAFRVMRSDAHPEFFGWSSNPGLIKRTLYQQYAPFKRMLHDQMSGLIKSEGRTVAYLLPGVARHIGQERTVTDPAMPARPTSRIQKLLRSAKKQLYYAGWRKSPY